MASIDKTYLESIDDANEFFSWYENKEERVKMNIQLGHIIHLYEEKSEYFKCVERALWNTSTAEDTYLIRNCNVSFVQSRLKEVYSTEFYEFILAIDEDEYTPYHTIWKIQRKNNTFYSFSEMTSKKDMTMLLDRIMVVGTTYFHEFLEHSLDALTHKIKNGFVINLTYFGGNLIFDNGTFRVYNKDTKEYDKKIDLGIYRGDIKLPKISHTFKLSDTKGYDVDGVILSGINEFHNVSDYKGARMEHLWRYIMSVVPKYVYKIIKH